MGKSERKYRATHPWITFELDLRTLPGELWMLLGEAHSKCDHLKGVPLRPEVAKELHLVYLAKGVLATTAIEGNTLSEEQVAKHLEGKLELPPSKEYLRQEIDNVLKACNIVWDHVLAGTKTPLTADVVKSFNKLVLNGLSMADEVVPGAVRGHSVGVARYKGPPAEDCEYLLDRLCRWLDELADASRGMAWASAMPVLRAALAHLYIAWIHPFGDGNGRTARLVEFSILVHAGIPTPAAHLLSNHYNETRTEYYRQLDRASRSGGDIVPFLVYAVQGFVDGLKDQIERIREQQLDITWRNYVYELFKHRESAANTRQRNLVLELSRKPRPEGYTPFEIRDITPRVAREYSQKSLRTLVRDLNALATMRLLVTTPRGFAANTDIIKAFLPRAADDGPPPRVEDASEADDGDAPAARS
ncbi:MAG: Fic family protein [Deltaproteobacteria bacterium]|nr:Fic family protein [Deltaproteobacteria bacterium]